jgi:predicted helicase
VDGALLYSLRVPFGYWEAKDEKDDLDAEIETKKRRGYPQDNIIFEDSRVFGIQAGVAISFLVKRRGEAEKGRIFYLRRPEMETREDKLGFLSGALLSRVDVVEVKPNKKHVWIEQINNDFESLMPVAAPSTKVAQIASQERAIFKLYSRGVGTFRDEWVYDLSIDQLKRKI